ncbi:FAS1-like dehydratase domain-containing protein [Nocardioides bruguierae]|uniref:MaoC family dehydratase N-terminal domain-containing protein n=1 Tax=Nocardioides bruguierae TaxID=2945102 RepID=A0A9X2D7K7_9ACTN|nr:MaoC family dehydratase N-terminal domain-containing protein [Nocardioides bruguierae]MCL8024563.1 MaoC family dehydratase N-terminal domain-containing protein [Nocardioides bruguierae]MCM0620820.1 MaoC family dehydratase N-terminal domain-containing protein [Nocardioides bruguierae]
MPVDSSLVGRAYPASRPYTVTDERVRAFAEATGGTWSGGALPATFPIVLAFDAMFDFLDAEGVALHRIVHGEQKFAYARPLAVGDVLSATLSVAGLRQIAGNDIITTSSEITDADGAVVCTATATLVHRAPGEEEQA